MKWIHTVLKGQLGTVEQFQHQMNWGLPGDDPSMDAAALLAFATLCAEKWKTTYDASPLALNQNPDVKYVEVSASQQEQTASTAANGTGGNLSTSEAQYFAWPVGTEPRGQGGSKSLPYEVSPAVTLQTDLRGASGRGRSYFPPIDTLSMDVDGLFQVAKVALVGNQLGAWFAAVMTGTTLKPVVVSRRRLVLNPITSLLMGRVPDAQRRRRRSQDEQRTVVWTA
jgi:hypothetical protein